MWRGAADAVPGTEAAWAPPDKVRGSAELALPGKKLLLAPSFCFFFSPGGFGFFDTILKLAPTGPCSSGSGSGSDSSSGTEREQNKSRHGKWCNSIHLQVNPSEISFRCQNFPHPTSHQDGSKQLSSVHS
nr:uncharacterized protein LOC116278013 isoform X2 [Vicugna pacos]